MWCNRHSCGRLQMNGRLRTPAAGRWSPSPAAARPPAGLPPHRAQRQRQDPSAVQVDAGQVVAAAAAAAWPAALLAAAELLHRLDPAAAWMPLLSHPMLNPTSDGEFAKASSNAPEACTRGVLYISAQGRCLTRWASAAGSCCSSSGSASPTTATRYGDRRGSSTADADDWSPAAWQQEILSTPDLHFAHTEDPEQFARQHTGPSCLPLP